MELKRKSIELKNRVIRHFAPTFWTKSPEDFMRKVEKNGVTEVTIYPLERRVPGGVVTAGGALGVELYMSGYARYSMYYFAKTQNGRENYSYQIYER